MPNKTLPICLGIGLIIVGARFHGLAGEGAPPSDWQYLGHQPDTIAADDWLAPIQRADQILAVGHVQSPAAIGD